MSSSSQGSGFKASNQWKNKSGTKSHHGNKAWKKDQKKGGKGNGSSFSSPGNKPWKKDNNKGMKRKGQFTSPDRNSSFSSPGSQSFKNRDKGRVSSKKGKFSTPQHSKANRTSYKKDMKSGHGSFSTGMKGKREGGFKGQKKHSADGQKSTTSVVNFGKQNINGKSLKRPRELEPDLGEESEHKPRKRKKQKTFTDKLADYVPHDPCAEDLVKAFNEHFKDHTVVEMGDVKIDHEMFNTCKPLEQSIAEYFQSLLPDWQKECKSFGKHFGSPPLIILNPSAVRSVNFNREIATFKGSETSVGKFFAKHIKLKSSINSLKNKTFHLGIGTPHRIQELLENGAMNLDRTKIVALDWTYRDPELMKRMEENVQIRKVLFKLLKEYVLPAAENGKLKIVLL